MPRCRRPILRYLRSLTRITPLAALLGLALVSLAPASGASALVTVANFNGSNGKVPMAGLTNVGGTLYGTSAGGGTDGGMAGDGTIFAYQLPTSPTGMSERGGR